MKALVVFPALTFMSLACIAPAQKATAAIGFPWLFHTRPKPVLVEPASLQPSRTEHQIVWHGTAVYPSSGRLYFKDSRDLVRAKQTNIHFSDEVRTSHAILKK